MSLDATKATDQHRSVRIALSRTRILVALSMPIVVFVVAHLLFSINRYIIQATFFGADNLYVIFDLWDEVSIPSWYSTSLLLIAALLLAVIAIAKRQSSDRYTRHWIGLALILLAMSIDDAADLHGHTSYKLQEMFETGGYFAYAWVIPAAVACVAVGVAYLRFLGHLPAHIRWRFVLAGALFIFGALVMEMIQTRHDTLYGVENMPYRIMVAVEESLEMVGVVVFVGALLSVLSDMAGRVDLRIRA